MSNAPQRPAGVGAHYAGERGDRYFDHQAAIGEVAARLDRWKFVPHVGRADTVVDFGCGGGSILASLEAARRIGVEPNDAARREAEARGLEMFSSLDELPDGVADVAISHHALEHTLQPFEELRSLRRVLAPGGRLVLWVPLDDWRAQRTPRQEPDHHLFTWTPQLLANLLGEAGFVVDRVRVVAHAWPPGYRSFASVLPRRAFDVTCRLASRALRRRQLAAFATRPPE